MDGLKLMTGNSNRPLAEKVAEQLGVPLCDVTLDRFAEAARQTAVADALIISKTDLAPLSAALAERLDALNPGADRILGAGNTDPASILFAPESPSPAPRERVADAKRRPGEGLFIKGGHPCPIRPASR